MKDRRVSVLSDSFKTGLLIILDVVLAIGVLVAFQVQPPSRMDQIEQQAQQQLQITVQQAESATKSAQQAKQQLDLIANFLPNPSLRDICPASGGRVAAILGGSPEKWSQDPNDKSVWIYRPAFSDFSITMQAPTFGRFSTAASGVIKPGDKTTITGIATFFCNG